MFLCNSSDRSVHLLRRPYENIVHSYMFSTIWILKVINDISSVSVYNR